MMKSKCRAASPGSIAVKLVVTLRAECTQNNRRAMMPNALSRRERNQGFAGLPMLKGSGRNPMQKNPGSAIAKRAGGRFVKELYAGS
jgi:hypothetical protein